MNYIPNNILVTGGCGFIGSNLINFLLNKHSNINIYNIDKLDYCAREKNVEQHQNYKFIKGDINQNDLISFVLNNYNIDTIIHLAAQSHVDNSFGNSIQFTKDNILGTHVLLECSVKYGKIKRFIHISTDEVYGEVENDADDCDENFILNPTNPYAASKAGAEFLVKSYYSSYNLPIIITRGNNVYGAKQYPEKLIPKFTKLLSENKKFTIQGTGNNTRNFINVFDVCGAIEIILEKGIINETYNIGTNNEYSVLDISKIILKHVKPNTNIDDWIEFIEDRNFNDKRYAINNKKLKSLGWNERIPFNIGISTTINWILKNKDYWD